MDGMLPEAAEIVAKEEKDKFYSGMVLDDVPQTD
jgi:hypothetical protein